MNEKLKSDQYLEGLSVHLVGGAVRDRLLGLEQGDRDWVVTGSTPKEMLNRGFRQVGKDFPVFLHPITAEEYALARKERKVGLGYHGFEFDSDSTVTLEEDLSRRDLTINAIAMDGEGRLIDPWGGQSDLQNRQLRHVSEAFAEDPVRILRVARFAARFEQQGFEVSSETQSLMQQMVSAGEVDALVAERVWQEMEKSLSHRGFYRFIEVLRSCGALSVLLPEVDRLFGVPQLKQYHPEIDTGTHTLMALKSAAKAGSAPEIVFAVLVHDLGKGVTPKEELPSHRGHEKTGMPLVEDVCERFRVPKSFRHLALKVCEFHLHLHRVIELKPKTVLKLIEQLDGFRNPQQVERFIAACTADKRGRQGMEQSAYPQASLLREYVEATNGVNTREISALAADKGKTGQEIGEAVRRARLDAIRKVRAA
ncbi:MAG: multifunctional CCA addition/repair protein [Acidiferrobacterales bacterium]|nr:multifunctional CCA addition/repair protein [Acidiferrobacterales bacterium]